QLYLKQIDSRWQNHLEELEDLRDSVSLRSYAQKNPLIEYKLEGSEIFDKMIDQIKTSVAKTVVRVQIRNDGPQRPAPGVRRTTETHRESLAFGNIAANQQKVARASANDHMQAPTQVIRTAPKVGRNDPCPCGSGKKYKNCCGRNTGV
ncbi:MAG: SEC-C domain-containing protein, partial [Spirochaetales bacterium]|nr:SEC-C domain-containing protein [Spirochaetales bacterium]